MKKRLILFLPVLLCWCTLFNEQKEQRYFESKDGVDSWRSGDAILQWHFDTQESLAWDYFLWEPELEEKCLNEKSLRWTQECPTYTVITFTQKDWIDLPWELFLKWESQKSINLWCIQDNTLFHDSYAIWLEDITLFNDETEILEKIKTKENVFVKISKYAYNILPRDLQNCDVHVQKVEILK